MPSTQVFGPTKKRCSVVPVSMATLFPRRTILSCPWDRNLALCRSDTVTCAASNPAIVGHGSPPFGSMSGEERICEQTFFRRKASSCKRRRRFCRTMCRCFISSVIPGYIFHESCHEFGPSGEEGENTLFSILRSLQDSKKIAAVVYALQWPLELARPAADRRKQSLGCGGDIFIASDPPAAKVPGARASRYRVYGVIGLHIGNYPKKN